MEGAVSVEAATPRVPQLDAPVLPGYGAAGIRLGQRMAEVLSTATLPFTADALINSCVQAPTGTVLYRSSSVSVWATDGVVDQVRVGAGYRGTLAGSVRVGSTRAELAAALGPAEDVEMDTVAFGSAPGLYVTLSGAPGWWDEKPDNATITEMSVFQ